MPPYPFRMFFSKKKKVFCCRQTYHFLQQLHIRQVVSSSQNRVEHSASCSIPWKSWVSSSTKKFQELHTCLTHVPIAVRLEQHNQDLVDFCTSRPIEQIMGSINHLVRQYAAKQAGDMSEISFTVQLAATEPKLKPGALEKTQDQNRSHLATRSAPNL